MALWGAKGEREQREEHAAAVGALPSGAQGPDGAQRVWTLVSVWAHREAGAASRGVPPGEERWVPMLPFLLLCLHGTLGLEKSLLVLLHIGLFQNCSLSLPLAFPSFFISEIIRASCWVLRHFLWSVSSFVFSTYICAMNVRIDLLRLSLLPWWKDRSKISIHSTNICFVLGNPSLVVRAYQWVNQRKGPLFSSCHTCSGGRKWIRQIDVHIVGGVRSLLKIIG